MCLNSVLPQNMMRLSGKQIEKVKDEKTQSRLHEILQRTTSVNNVTSTNFAAYTMLLYSGNSDETLSYGTNSLICAL